MGKADPFRKPKGPVEAGRRLWQHLVTDDTPPTSTVQPGEVVSWHKHSETKRLMAYLQEEIDRPADVAAHLDMISQTARANTFKELMQRLRRELVAARMQIEEMNE